MAVEKVFVVKERPSGTTIVVQEALPEASVNSEISTPVMAPELLQVASAEGMAQIKVAVKKLHAGLEKSIVSVTMARIIRICTMHSAEGLAILATLVIGALDRMAPGNTTR